MSLYKAEQAKFRAIDNLLRQEDRFDCAKVVKKVLKYPGAVQQMIITLLIFLYSHFAPKENRIYYTNSTAREESSARRGMANLRQVIHVLAHSDSPEPRAGHYFKVKLSAWQNHLLQHFEVLAPLPVDTKTEEEAYEFMWGETWCENLNLQLDCNFVKLTQLAHLAYDLGVSLPQIIRSGHNLQDSQEDTEPLTPLTINQLCRELDYVSKSVLRRCNHHNPQRPRTVDIEDYFGQDPSRNAFPEFLVDPTYSHTTLSDRFPPSALETCLEDFD